MGGGTTVLEALGEPTLVRVKLQPLDADGELRVANAPARRNAAQVLSDTPGGCVPRSKGRDLFCRLTIRDECVGVLLRRR
jgi:hypothetical protein